MTYFILPILIFTVLVTLFHIIGFKTKGKYPKSIWKSGDYIWLSMAFFALLSGSAELRKQDASTQLLSTKVELIKNLEKGKELVNQSTDALRGLILDSNEDSSRKLEELANKSEINNNKIKKNDIEISNAKENLSEWFYEDWLIYLFPFFLSFALAIRLTMASAEVFDWYSKGKT